MIKNKKPRKIQKMAILLIVILLFFLGFYLNKLIKNKKNLSQTNTSDEIILELEKKVLPAQGIPLSLDWNNFGKRIISAEVIDQKKLEDIYQKSGGLSDEGKKLVYQENNNNIRVTKGNAQILLNLFWAFGLSNKNQILERGPIADPKYGGADRFASTGGWTLSLGSPMNYYNKFTWVSLSSDQQSLVEKVSKQIFRPCCDNSTYFPDCNHGMAMLGYLELASYRGADESTLYQEALSLNSFWFPQNYLTIAKYFYDQGIAWESVNPKLILGSDYSSLSGFKIIQDKVDMPVLDNGGSSCKAG